jgi:uncharacterized protein with NAD-binding domain and iron-sulfur cluster
MNGIQYFLKRDVPIAAGHQSYADSAWALTAISQRQFWPGFDFSRAGDGKTAGILSVDISDWTTPGERGGPARGKTALRSTRDQIAAEVWFQMRRDLAPAIRDALGAEVPPYWMDDDIRWHSDAPHREVNLEPLLVNEVNSWGLRPDAITAIPNLFLAADYVRTHTDLATMEAANEAGRRAANGILSADGSSLPPARIWDLHEPAALAPLRAYDRNRWRQGLPWVPTTSIPAVTLRDLRARFNRWLGE